MRGFFIDVDPDIIADKCMSEPQFAAFFLARIALNSASKSFFMELDGWFADSERANIDAFLTKIQEQRKRAEGQS
ncbi:hypothetical protein [Brucella intermedia]|uniref:hypothetical protein n=1 Tax=Brucella intermedia TaxID=94625 RepID=UPI002361A3A6|nr:hypothetical protein [Brucella intermedia]